MSLSRAAIESQCGKISLKRDMAVLMVLCGSRGTHCTGGSTESSTDSNTLGSGASAAPPADIRPTSKAAEGGRIGTTPHLRPAEMHADNEGDVGLLAEAEKAGDDWDLLAPSGRHRALD